MKAYVGIDVCESWLDVHILPAGIAFRVANGIHGHHQVKRRLKTWNVALIVIEATGKWHRARHRSLHAGGYAAAVVNPLRARLAAARKDGFYGPLLVVVKSRPSDRRRAWPGQATL